ncbi:MAG TPA: AAA family ATPase, partial [Acidimicrobiales bacterium]|nr:AAA family ATPase [Acidimicrobiales bacterium]
LERVMARQADEICKYLSKVALTRVGPAGAQAEVGGLEVETARVSHLTSREGDPHRHVHLMLNARVKAPDGSWRSLHSVAVRQHIRSVNALGQRVLLTDKAFREALASRGYSLGADGEVDQAREAVGLMSKRAAQVEAGQAGIEAAWRAAHPGEEPSARVAHGWHHQAWEDGRRAKAKVAESPAELSERVRAELAEVGLDFSPGRRAALALPAALSVGQVGRDALAAEVVAGLSAARSAWSAAELTAATEKALVSTGVVGDAQAVAELAEDLRARAEGLCRSVLEGQGKVPSVMSRHLTSAAVIEADMALNLALAGLAGTEGPRDASAEAAARGYGLSAGQAEAAAAVAGASGLEVVVGPAGTGKTAMLAAAKEALERQGRGLVVLAPTRKAAQVASEELAVPASSVSKLLYDYGWRWDDLGRYSHPAAPLPFSGQPGPPTIGDLLEMSEPPPKPPHGQPGGLRLSAGSVVVVDEAGLLSVDQAAALAEVVRGAGASLRLVGDPRQLGAVGRGGVMEAAARWAPGGGVTLAEVHRFLALEEGPDGLPVTVPDRAWAGVCEQLREATAPAAAADALVARGAVVVHQSRDELVAALAGEAARAGREGALAVTVSTNADAREVSLVARMLRVAAGEVDDDVVAVGMDGVRIGRGDRVVTRRNDNAAGVANRETWMVGQVKEDGSLVLAGRHRQVVVPPEYVSAGVQLGYAATDYGNQGVTAARSATWVSTATSSGGLYVGASRGRWQNTLHVVAGDLEEAKEVVSAAIKRDRADRGLEAARERAEAEALRPAPGRGVVPAGWVSAAELAETLRRIEADLAHELSLSPLVPVADEAAWRAESEADRAEARDGRTRAAWHEAELGRAKAARAGLFQQARAEFSQAREDARAVAAGPGLLGQRAARVAEAKARLAELAERWRYHQLPGERWGDQAVAEAAERAAEGLLAQTLRFHEAEADKAGFAARTAERRMADRDERRARSLEHNESARGRRESLVAEAEMARAGLAERRQRLTAGMAPELVQAVDAARDAQRAELARAREAQELAQELARGHHHDLGWDRGPGRGMDRDGGLGFGF